MRTVYKYPIDLANMSEVHITVSDSATVVLFGHQETLPPDHVAVWIETDTEYEQHERIYRVIGTGHNIPFRAAHCGSCIVEPHVWHLYRIV